MSTPADSDTASSLRTRASLLMRVHQWQDSASWNEFYRLYHKLIYGLARRSGLTHADAEDVTQDVFKRVAETIQEFESNPQRGTFRGWLMNLTRWRITDKFRSHAKTPEQQKATSTANPDATSTQTSTINRLPDAAAGTDGDWDLEWQRHLLDAACERLARRTNPRHFQAFDLYVRQNRPVLQVSSELGLNPARVYLIGHRLTKELKAEVAKLREQLG